MKQKIALVDIDQCLISNRDSEYNENLLGFLEEGKYDQIWLISGRTTQDLIMHVLKDKPEQDQTWKMQLLINIEKQLTQRFSVKFRGISTPHDHVLQTTPGTGREKYKALEQQLNNINNHVEFRANNESRFIEDENIVMQLVLSDDTEKKGQTQHLLNYIATTQELQNTEIDFFDDKDNNLKNVMDTLKFNDIQTVRGYLTDISVSSGMPDLKYPPPQHKVGLRSHPTTQHHAERAQTAARYINKSSLAAGLVAIASCTGIGYQQLINNQRSTNSKDTNHR